MTYEDAMMQMKQGRSVKRAGWDGYVRIEGLQVIRVKPGLVLFRFHASREDQAAADWIACEHPGSDWLRLDVSSS